MARSIKVLIAVFVLMVTASGAAQAVRPTRTVFDAEGFVLPAGSGCSFKVAIEPADDPPTLTETEFSDGGVTGQIRDGFISLTNVKTGESIVHHSQYRVSQTYDASTNQILEVWDGTAFWWFLPGDVGPYGVVGKPGLLLSITGHVETTYDLETNAITSFELDGQVNFDICAALSP